MTLPARLPSLADLLEPARKGEPARPEAHQVRKQPSPARPSVRPCTNARRAPVLRRIDDEIFEHTTTAFPELLENDHAKLNVIDEEWMKSESGKTRWRDFIQS